MGMGLYDRGNVELERVVGYDDCSRLVRPCRCQPRGRLWRLFEGEPPVNLALSGLDRPQAPVIVEVLRVVGDAWSGGLGSYQWLVEVEMEVDVHPLTQTGGGAGLTSLQEGKRHSATGLGRLRAPVIAEILRMVGDACSSSLGSHWLRAAVGGRCCEGVRNHPWTQTGGIACLTSL